MLLQGLKPAAQLGEFFANLDALLARGGRGVARLVEVAAHRLAGGFLGSQGLLEFADLGLQGVFRSVRASRRVLASSTPTVS